MERPTSDVEGGSSASGSARQGRGIRVSVSRITRFRKIRVYLRSFAVGFLKMRPPWGPGEWTRSETLRQRSGARRASHFRSGALRFDFTVRREAVGLGAAHRLSAPLATSGRTGPDPPYRRMETGLGARRSGNGLARDAPATFGTARFDCAIQSPWLGFASGGGL